MYEIKTLRDVPFVDFVNLVNFIFKDYALPVKWDVLNLRLDMREYSLSDETSFVFYENKKPVGFVLTGMRRNIARIDAMGVIPEKRGTGLAKTILEHALEVLKWHGAEKVILEVAEEDKRAVRFYEKHGFREVRRLFTVAYKRDPALEYKTTAKFYKTDARWIHKSAIEAEFSLPRKPNWQREPLTLLLSNGRYTTERVAINHNEGYLVWGKTVDSAFIVDAAPTNDKKIYPLLIENSVSHIFSKVPYEIITVTSVPEDDPFYEALVEAGFKNIFTQKEMYFKLPI